MTRYTAELCLACSLLGTAPLLLLQAFHLCERPHFQFFPIAWIAFTIFTVKCLPVAPAQSLWRRRIATLAWGLGLLACVFSVLLFSPWIANLSAILSIYGWGLLRLENITSYKWTAWNSLLLVALPLPGSWDSYLIATLQSMSSSSASSILDLIGVLHLRQGNILEIRTGKLFVDEACSGVDSLYALGAIAVLILLLQQRPLLVGVLSLATVPLWSWFGNVLRLTVIAYLLDAFNFDLTTGWKHSALGLVVFALMAACFYQTLDGVAQLTKRFSMDSLPQEKREWHLAFNRLVGFPGVASHLVQPQNSYFHESATPDLKQLRSLGFVGASITKHRVLPYISLVAFSVLGITACFISAGLILKEKDLESALALPSFKSERIDKIITKDSLPLTLSGTGQIAFQPTHRENDKLYGEHSRTWTYMNEGTTFMLSIDFPFRGFHPLWVCYTNTGHQILNTSTTELSPNNSTTENNIGEAWVKPYTVHRLMLRDEIGESTFVLFVNVDQHGDQVANQAEDTVSKLIVDRLLRPTPANFRLPPVAFQFQLVVTAKSFTDTEKQKYEHIFAEALPYAIQAIDTLAQE